MCIRDSPELEGVLQVGMEVIVPFGKGNKETHGYVIGFSEKADYDLAKIKDALKVAKVKGRIEMVKVSDDFTLMIDYAHNAMALESLLHTLRD